LAFCIYSRGRVKKEKPAQVLLTAISRLHENTPNTLLTKPLTRGLLEADFSEM
jgi:hypothetical protein